MLFLRRYTQSVDADCTERRAYNAVRDDGGQLLLLLLLNNLCDVTSRHVIFDLHLPITHIPRHLWPTGISWSRTMPLRTCSSPLLAPISMKYRSRVSIRPTVCISYKKTQQKMAQTGYIFRSGTCESKGNTGFCWAPSSQALALAQALHGLQLQHVLLVMCSLYTASEAQPTAFLLTYTVQLLFVYMVQWTDVNDGPNVLRCSTLYSPCCCAVTETLYKETFIYTMRMTQTSVAITDSCCK